MPRLLRSALRLGRNEWRDLLAAQWLLLRTQLRLRLTTPGRLVTPASPDADALVLAAQPRQRAVVMRAAWAVDRVIAFGPLRARCLGRALTLHQLLERRGVTGATVRVGVRPTGGRLDAHAWVEWAGQVVGDRAEHVQGFAVMPGLAFVDDR